MPIPRLPARKHPPEYHWAVGDCGVIVDKEGKPYPATAQHAVREGVHLARNLARTIEGKPTKACDITTTGSLAALGGLSGVGEIKGLRFSGLVGWLLCRLIYLGKMPGIVRTVRVGLDWIMNGLFPRDYVQLGLAGRRRTERGGPAIREPAQPVERK